MTRLGFLEGGPWPRRLSPVLDPEGMDPGERKVWQHTWIEKTPDGEVRLFYVNARTVEWRELGTVPVRQLLRKCAPWDDCVRAFRDVVTSAVPPSPSTTASQWGSWDAVGRDA